MIITLCVDELSNSSSSSDQNSQPTGWELELVTASTSNVQGASIDNKLVSLLLYKHACSK